MRYTEEDIRNAFRAGMNKGAHRSYYDAPLDEDEFVEELNSKSNWEELKFLVKKELEEKWESLDEDSIQKILGGYATIAKNMAEIEKNEY